jgi:hypothetical protein
MQQLKVNTENVIKSNMAETLTRVSRAMSGGSMHVLRIMQDISSMFNKQSFRWYVH